VLSEGPVSMVSLLTASGYPSRSERTWAELPSRVADNLFWLGRYSERLENTLRLLRCMVLRMADESGGEASPELTALARTLVRLDLLPERFRDHVPLKDLEHEVLLLLYKHDRFGSARQTLSRVRGIASIVRDRLSADTWSILNKLTIDARARPRRIPLADALALMNAVIVDLSAFSGMEMENMTRGLGWRFLDVGRRLERATHQARLFRAALCGGDKADPVLEPLLEISDSLMTFRRRYFTGVQISSVLELLVLDAGNPRALAFQLNALREHTALLPHEPNPIEPSAEQKRLVAFQDMLGRLNISEYTQMEDGVAGEALDSLFADFVVELGVLSNHLTHHYFTHTVASVS
jgi:uncharacterized alpha-E superfamily protein